MSGSSGMDPYTDVVELCALLQCLGFSVKNLRTNDSNSGEEGNARTVIINCQASGFHVVLESQNISCSCPVSSQQQNSGFWQVSGISGGKQLDKEWGSALLGYLPKVYRERLSKELLEIVRCIKENNESDLDKPKERESLGNKSASMLELNTPEKCLFQLPLGTPTRYRSLDTLTNKKDEVDQNLPSPGPLQKHTEKQAGDRSKQSKNQMCNRQCTYTLSSTPDNIKRRNKTSSPIQGNDNKILENLMSVEKTVDELRNKVANMIKEIKEEKKHDSSISSLVLDVSKISVLKGNEPKAQFVSSPNLSSFGSGIVDFKKSKLKRCESASTSNLAPNKPTTKEGKFSKLRRISPNIFKTQKDTPTACKNDPQNVKNNRLNSLFKPKITPARSPQLSVEQNMSPNLNASRKKFSHVKSTIPRPATKKE